jgi:hypothetical protein
VRLHKLTLCRAYEQFVQNREITMTIDDKERQRRRRLLKTHVDAENAHDLDAIMATFSPHAVNTLNEIVATDSATTRMVHESFGFSTASGLLGSLQVVPSAEHFTDEEIIHEGHLRGTHSGFVLGFPAPTFRQVQLPYVAIYRFDEHDLLVSERVKIDLSPLYAEAPSQIGGGT